MTKRTIFILLIVIVLIIAFFIGRQFWSPGETNAPPPITSHFDTNDEAWRVIGDAQAESSEPTYRETGGVDGGGHISATDDGHGGVWYFEAPERFLGDKRAYFGSTLMYQLRQSETSRQFTSNDIVIEGTEHTLVYRFDRAPEVDWTSFSVALDDTAEWYIDTYGETRATVADIQAVLANVISLRIRGEYRTGSDSGALDAVRLQ